jgi:hypothetical protein
VTSWVIYTTGMYSHLEAYFENADLLGHPRHLPQSSHDRRSSAPTVSHGSLAVCTLGFISTTV